MKTLFLSAAALFMVVMTSEANSFDKGSLIEII